MMEAKFKTIRCTHWERSAFFSDNNIEHYDFVFDRISGDRKTIFYEKTNRQAILDLFRHFSIDKNLLKEIFEGQKNSIIVI